MRRTRLLLAAAVVAAGLVYLIIGGIRGAVVFYITPGELLAQGPSAQGKSLRIGGQVQPGSRTWDASTQQLRFVLTDGGAAIPVRYTGAPPGLFTEGQGAIVEGTLGSDGTFQARNIIVKHTEEYKPPSPAP
jgi:cytochrome c-type biogenesis protein CcmE